MLLRVTTIVKQDHNQHKPNGENGNSNNSNCEVYNYNKHPTFLLQNQKHQRSVSLQHLSYFPSHISTLNTISITKIARNMNHADDNSDSEGAVSCVQSYAESSCNDTGFAYIITCNAATAGPSFSPDIHVLLLDPSSSPHFSHLEGLSSSSPTSVPFLKEIGTANLNQALSKLSPNLFDPAMDLAIDIKGVLILKPLPEKSESIKNNKLLLTNDTTTHDCMKQNELSVLSSGSFEVSSNKEKRGKTMLQLNIIVSYQPTDTAVKNSERSMPLMPINLSLVEKSCVAMTHFSLVLSSRYNQKEQQIKVEEINREEIVNCEAAQALINRESESKHADSKVMMSTEDMGKDSTYAVNKANANFSHCQSEKDIHMKLDTLLQAVSKLECVLISKIDSLERRVEDQNFRLSALEKFVRHNA